MSTDEPISRLNDAALFLSEEVIDIRDRLPDESSELAERLTRVARTLEKMGLNPPPTDLPDRRGNPGR